MYQKDKMQFVSQPRSHFRLCFCLQRATANYYYRMKQSVITTGATYIMDFVYFSDVPHNTQTVVCMCSANTSLKIRLVSFYHHSCCSSALGGRQRFGT